MNFRPPSNREGAALAVAVLALAVIGALVAATFVAALLEQRSGENILSAEQAFSVAEAGLDALTADWNPALYDSITTGATVGMPPVDLFPGFRYTDSLTRLNAVTFLARAWGERLGPTGTVSRHALGRYLRMDIAAPPVDAGLTALGAVSLGPAAMVTGVDSVPPGWGAFCPPSGSVRPGIRSRSGAISSTSTCQGGPCVLGNPPLLVDSGLTANNLASFGSVSFTQLFAEANVRVSGIQPGISPALDTLGRCDFKISSNWGEPSAGTSTGACFGYFPVVAAAGGTRISGGRGQGILLVDGDLDVSGGFEFYGPLVIRGRLASFGNGGRFMGGILLLDDLGLGSSLDGSSIAVYSSCGLLRAELGAARGVPILERSWIDGM